MKKIFLVFFFSAIAVGIYFLVQNYRDQERLNQILSDTEVTEKPVDVGSAPAECADERDRVQLIDSEKCVWECSSYYTAPTEERCVACKGVVVPQKCPMCPSLCRPSFWNWEKIR